MATGITLSKPRGVLKFLLKLPVWLYRIRLGWVLGNRFLMLTHTGLQTGLPRQVVLEVVSYQREINAYFVASGWHGKSDWYKNIQVNPSVWISTHNRTYAAYALIIDQSEAADIFLDYAQKHTLAFRELTKFMMNKALQPTYIDCLELARSVPLVELIPDFSL